MSNQEKDDGRTNVGFNVPDNSNMDQASPNFSTSDVVRTFDGQLLLMTEKNQNSSQIVTPNSANISKAKYQVYSRVKRLCILAHKALELYKMVQTYDQHRMERLSIRLLGNRRLRNSSQEDLLFAASNRAS